ncbi:uncharacterized protein LOC124449219, partial [Xenia sp. Carnegie-2017]|uniref:uncharacterized protein LOC124449219 n=1 Tax=Xenia sp. Carnegie-2017 TaxID=2897299 RepID=UPI001F047FAC
IGERAKKLFENLKKRFSKQRNNFKKVTKSGTSLSAVVSSKTKLKDYNFLQWLVPYIKSGATKTNLSVSNTGSGSTSNCSLLTNDEIEHVSLLNEDNGCQRIKPDEVFDDKITDISDTTRHKKWSKTKVDVEQEEIQFLHLFGMLVASQLKKLNTHEQAIAKHQIQNVVFNMQMNQNPTTNCSLQNQAL